MSGLIEFILNIENRLIKEPAISTKWRCRGKKGPFNYGFARKYDIETILSMEAKKILKEGVI